MINLHEKVVGSHSHGITAKLSVRNQTEPEIYKFILHFENNLVL